MNISSVALHYIDDLLLFFGNSGCLLVEREVGFEPASPKSVLEFLW